MDWDHIYNLLVVVRECTSHPKLSTLMHMALAELQQINDSQGEEEEDGA